MGLDGRPTLRAANVCAKIARGKPGGAVAMIPSRGRMRGLAAAALLCLAVAMPAAKAEDGYELWLRYSLLPPEPRAALTRVAAGIVAPVEASPTLRAAAAELQRGVSGLSGRPVPVTTTATNGSLV